MSRAARALAALAAALGLLAAGCGGGGASDAARFAPAGAELFVVVDTDFDSEQWQRAGDVVESFPDGDRFLAFLLGKLADEGVDFDRDVRPAVGPELGIVALDLAGEATPVGFTQPRDRQSLERLLARADEDVVTRVMGEWTVFAEDDAALDAFEEGRVEGSLADADGFEAVMGAVSEEALAHVYVSSAGIEHGLDLPAGALESFFPAGEASPLAGALLAEEGGVRVEAALRLDEEDDGFVGDPYEAALPEEVPAGAILYVSFNDLERPLSALRDALARIEPGIDRDLARLETAIGVSLEEDVFPLFAGEAALYVRPGLLIPEVTLLLEIDDEQAARDVLARLVEAIPDDFPVGPPREIEVAGVEAVELSVEGAPIALYYATFEGRLVVTTSREGIADLRADGGERLVDDEAVEDALQQAGVPDETLGYVYADLAALVPLVFQLTGQAGNAEGDVLRRNLEPLEHAVLHGERDGEIVKLRAFLAIE